MAVPPDRLPAVGRDRGFVEVADRCWVARHAFLDVNVGVVGGDRGLLVVDTQASEALAAVALEQVRGLGAGEVVAVVNTHDHFDHCFGNGVFAEAYDDLAIHAHEAAAGVVPTSTFSSARALDLGDRLVELVHPGRGHTAGDSIVLVPDAGVVFAGDLVEESAERGDVPGFGDDSFPIEWPRSLDLVIGLLSDAAVVVPGHGSPVGKDFVVGQADTIGVVAETIRGLAGRGVPVGDALTASTWPYPAEDLVHAVNRGYSQLPRAARSLPLA